MTQAANLAALGTNAGTTGILPIAGGGTAGTGGAIGFKNRIINGAMTIDQRNAGASVTAVLDKTFSCDRWMSRNSASSKFSMQQDAGGVTPPAGFSDYLGVTSLAATSVGSSDYYAIQGVVEGYNVADFNWGTANAKTITLSFWVRSSLTGTFGGSLTNYDNTQSYIFNYNISAANTWEQKSITIVGPTTGTWNVTNSGAFNITFSLGIGSTFRSTANSWLSGNFFTTSGETQVVGTNGATFYITGVQLEVGTAATNFDVRSYTTELQLCQRYCNVYGGEIYAVFGTMAFAFSGTGFASATTFPVEMRALPTVAYTGNTRAVSGSDSIAVTSVAFNNSNSTRKIAVVEPAVASGLTTNRGYFWSANNDATARAIFSAEL